MILTIFNLFMFVVVIYSFLKNTEEWVKSDQIPKKVIILGIGLIVHLFLFFTPVYDTNPKLIKYEVLSISVDNVVAVVDSDNNITKKYVDTTKIKFIDSDEVYVQHSEYKHTMELWWMVAPILLENYELHISKENYKKIMGTLQ